MTEDDRRAALALMWERFPAVEDRVRRVYGLRLPRHLAVLCALLGSVDRAEKEGLSYLGVARFGLTEYFGDGGLDLVGRDGLDERLQGRYRQDPPEFVTVLGGDSDGLHFGLWYDDPSDLPALTVRNYARDSAETWVNKSVTLLDELRSRIDRVADDYGEDGPEAQQLRALAVALDWFGEADEEALRADGLSRRPPRRAFTGVSVFPLLPTGSGDPRLSESNQRLEGFGTESAEALEWIAQAERELAAGEPAFALAVGAELHWLDRDPYRTQSRDLLVGAYRALGRDALAEIAEVHIANRDLRSVDVLVRPSS